MSEKELDDIKKRIAATRRVLEDAPLMRKYGKLEVVAMLDGLVKEEKT